MALYNITVNIQVEADSLEFALSNVGEAITPNCSEGGITDPETCLLKDCQIIHSFQIN